jgi:hypothetical protein
VWLTHQPGSRVRPRRGADLVVEVATLPPQQMVTSGRRMLTSRPRTAADCLRHLSPPDAVAVADAAARDGVPRAALAGVLAEQASWPYAATAATSLALVDPHRETWLGSWSVVRLNQHGVPMPEPQAVVRDVRGRFVARVDCWWPQHGVVGEADGQEKYRRAGLRTPDSSVVPAVLALRLLIRVPAKGRDAQRMPRWPAHMRRRSGLSWASRPFAGSHPLRAGGCSYGCQAARVTSVAGRWGACKT